VIRVLERERDTVIGELRGGRRHPVVLPDDPRIGREVHVTGIDVGGAGPAPREGDKVVVKLAEWTRRELPPSGVVIERLGRTHEPAAELRAVLLRYKLDRAFPAAVEAEAAALPDRVPAGHLAGREDFRRRAVFTIDPDDAKDFDDALSYEELPHGAVRVGVHIADVSAYVRPGTALDAEAQRRGNSTYLVGTVVPMLPEKLSHGLCSLVEGEDRLCKAVLLTFDAKGALAATDFAETVIRSRKRLTYRQAHALMFNDDLEGVRALPPPPRHRTGSSGRALRDVPLGELRDLQRWVRALWNIGRRLRADRMAHGSLDLDMPETRILVDAEGRAEALERIEHDESHQLVEEFMLAANEAVARLTRARRLPSLYRVHDDPEPARLLELRESLAASGIKVGDLSLRREFTRLLSMLATHPQGHTLRIQLLRSLRKAEYRYTPDGHFGLHKRDYTHFTSPIRRYADLVVHRAVATHLAATGAGKGHDLAHVNRLGDHLTKTEVNSAEAERESIKVKLVEYFDRELGREPPARFAAIITDVRAHGFFVELTESLTFGFVPADLLPADRYDLDEAGPALNGRRHRRRYALNTRLEVVVARVDRHKRLIDFRPAPAAPV
jgi:ribonuclease R